jgi:hypothetical protein
MRTWASVDEVTWNDPEISWTGTAPGRRTNFLFAGWYQEQQDDFQDVINFAEGRLDDPVFV